MRCTLPLVAILLVLTGCQSTYYSMWEKFGWEKRDILKERITSARDEQKNAQQQFKTTLDRFKELTGFQGGDLEAKYNKLKSQYESCESRASAVTSRINAVETVARDMFTEWTQEITQYQDPSLKASSQRKLDEARAKYQQLISVMRKAESRMPPVLARFKDHVLFLKHNLNASAIASLQGTSTGIETDVSTLVSEMETSIAEANAFIATMK